MIRTLNGQFLTEVANHPLVRSALGDGDAFVDLVPAVADPNNYTWAEEPFGGFMFLPLYEGVYEGHTILKANRSARKALVLASQVIEAMFIRTLAQAILTKVPDDNAGAGWMAEKLGFVRIGHRNDAWKPGVGVAYWKLDLDAWMKACSTLVERGRAFHETLERAKVAAGSVIPTHADDEYHDRAVGAAIAMIMAGNTVKGLDTYNRWAVFAGYAPAVLVSLQPFVVDIHDAVLGLNHGEIEVLQCR